MVELVVGGELEREERAEEDTASALPSFGFVIGRKDSLLSNLAPSSLPFRLRLRLWEGRKLLI